MHGAGDAAAVDAASCILPLLCHGFHCRGLSGSCRIESMGKWALVNFSHLQSFCVTKEDISRHFFLFYTLSQLGAVEIQGHYCLLPWFSWPGRPLGTLHPPFILCSLFLFSNSEKQNSQKYSQRTNFEEIRYHHSPLGSRNTYQVAFRHKIQTPVARRVVCK